MKLAVIVHRYDQFFGMPQANGRPLSRYAYLLGDILDRWKDMGNSWQVATLDGHDVDADAAFLHVDSTVVPDDYLGLARRYGFVVNGETIDISKRKVSRNLLMRSDAWDGPVLIKSNLNNFGAIEKFHNECAQNAGEPVAHRVEFPEGGYRACANLAAVPDEIWGDPTLVVERMLPEVNRDGTFGLRSWVFCGSRERCTRFKVKNVLSKAHDIVDRQPCDVPPEIRAERARLGFDYGKFDFAVHRGKPVLFDANRTPGNPLGIQDHVKAGAANLAEGLAELLKEAKR